MTPKETRELNKHLEAAAAILFKNTPPEKLQDFESLELALREQLTKHVYPTFGRGTLFAEFGSALTEAWSQCRARLGSESDPSVFRAALNARLGIDLPAWENRG